jgi:hypothetical protein
VSPEDPIVISFAGANKSKKMEGRKKKKRKEKNGKTKEKPHFQILLLIRE